MPQNITQLNATGTYSDSSTQDVTVTSAWSVSDTSLATVGAGTGLLTLQTAGKIWGGTIGVTATLAPGTPGTASIIIVASDSGSIAPRMPQSTDQWVALGLSPWGSYWGLQEPSGSNLVSSGTTVIALTASTQTGAGVGPQNGSTEPGWLRNFIVMTGSAAMNYAFPAANGPGTNKSIAFLAYARVGQMGAVSAGQLLGVLRNNSVFVANMCYDPIGSNTGMVGVEFNTLTKRLTGPGPLGMYDRVHPYLLVINTGSFSVLAATDIGVLTSASADGNGFQFTTDNNSKGFGAFGGYGKCASGTFGYFAICTGSVAESLSDPQNAAGFLQKLGWNVSWASCPTDSGTIKLPFMPFHWTSLGISPWTATWNLQESAAGGLFSNDGWPKTNWLGWSLTPGGPVDAFAESRPNWSRRGVRFTETINHRAIVTDVVNNSNYLFNPTGSFAILSYATISGSSTSGAARLLTGIAPAATAVGNAGVVAALMGSAPSPLPVIYCAGATATGSQAITDTNVHPFLLVYDTTNSRVKLYTDLEKVTGSFVQTQLVTSVTASLGIGCIPTLAGGTLALSGTHTYFSFTTGTQAESYSDDGVASKFLKSMGWTIPW